MEVVSNSCDYSTMQILSQPLIKKCNDIKEVIFFPNVEKRLTNIVKEEGFVSYKMTRRIIPNNASSYMGELYEVDIKGETNDGSKEIYIFLKHVISGGLMDSIVKIKTCYSHEALFYTDLCTMFKKLQDNANVPEREKFKIAKSYGCISEAIILENLAKKGFKTLNRMDDMTLEFAALSITQLAKLHGLSFVLEHTRTDYFEKNIKTLESSVIFDDIDTWKKIVKSNIEITTSHFDKSIQEKINYFLNNSFYKKFPKYMSGDNDTVKCLGHGDFRISNVMIKESGEEGSEVVLIDFQFLLCRSPIIDLLYFIYTGTDRKLRKAHMDHLRELYHDKLSEFLQYFSMDINYVYPKKVYLKDFVDFLDFGLMVALYISTVIFPSENELLDLHNDSFHTIKLDERYKKRVTEAVEEYMEWGILH